VSCNDPAYNSDSYISLLPGEERTITIAFPSGGSKPAIGLRGWILSTVTTAAKGAENAHFTACFMGNETTN
jgi:hypothetical protein